MGHFSIYAWNEKKKNMTDHSHASTHTLTHAVHSAHSLATTEGHPAPLSWIPYRLYIDVQTLPPPPQSPPASPHKDRSVIVVPRTLSLAGLFCCSCDPFNTFRLYGDTWSLSCDGAPALHPYTHSTIILISRPVHVQFSPPLSIVHCTPT